MRAWLVLIAAFGCKDQPKHAASKPFGDDPAVWSACDQAIARAQAAPPAARARILIEGCRVCDWGPLLAWNTPHSEGGPKRTEIEAAMLACGYCDPNAKQRFLGTLDNARGTESRAPWRQLADVCKAEVSAVPDNRFASAPYYALDRIARKASARGGDTAARLGGLEIALPALTISGTGVALPVVDRVAPAPGLHVTVLGDAIHVGRLPRATLGAQGVTVDLGPAGYPGMQVSLADLASVLDKAMGEDKRVVVLAPSAAPAAGTIRAIAEAANAGTVYLGAAARDAPTGWSVPAAIPVALAAGADVSLAPGATVQSLAELLALETRERVGLATP